MCLSISQCSLWSPSSSSFLISAFRWLMFSLLAFSLSFNSVISWLVLFFAASIFSLVLCSSSPTADTDTSIHVKYDGSHSNYVNATHLYRTTNSMFPLCVLCFYVYYVCIHTLCLMLVCSQGELSWCGQQLLHHGCGILEDLKINTENMSQARVSFTAKSLISCSTSTLRHVDKSVVHVWYAIHII